MENPVSIVGADGKPLGGGSEIESETPPPAQARTAWWSTLWGSVAAADKPAQTKLGSHRHKDGQRLDHLASHYLQDPNGFWRIAELNEVALPDAIADADLIDIPVAGG